MALVVTWTSVEQQSLSRASGTKSMGLNPFPGMNSWANLGGPSGTKTGGMFPHSDRMNFQFATADEKSASSPLTKLPRFNDPVPHRVFSEESPKGRAKFMTPLRGGCAAAREFLSWLATGESETHRTAGGKAARMRSGIYSNLLTPRPRGSSPDSFGGGL